MQSEEVGFQSTFERGQRLGCSDVLQVFKASASYPDTQTHI